MLNFCYVATSLIQSAPLPSTPLCPGDRLVFTCTSRRNLNEPEAIVIIWRRDSEIDLVQSLSFSSLPETVDNIRFSIEQVGNVIVSNATIESVPGQMNWTNIECSTDLGISYDSITINITSITEPVNSIELNPISYNSLFINWTASGGSCISHYNVVIFNNNTNTESLTTNDTNTTISPLMIGTNYSFIVIPIDTGGREGPPSSLIHCTWNVPGQVVNVSWYQISNDSVTIAWNKSEDGTMPLNYSLTVNDDIPINTTETRAKILCDFEAEPCSVTIAPVNNIGYGPPVTINVGVTPTMSSSCSFITSTGTRSISSIMQLPDLSAMSSTKGLSGTASHANTINTTSLPSSTAIPSPGGINFVLAAIFTSGVALALITAIIVLAMIILMAINKQRSKIISKRNNPRPSIEDEYDDIINKQGPIYDTPMEIDSINRSTDITLNGSTVNEDIDLQYNAAYGYRINEIS
uniref:Fibronectin type-III domain-containing protein n=1 Tax=Amphimedon queenslandica TaxID=400682 RepID=A0A1X7UPJ0_AMPQE